jgi:hypothetical protein
MNPSTSLLPAQAPGYALAASRRPRKPESGSRRKSDARRPRCRVGLRTELTATRPTLSLGSGASRFLRSSALSLRLPGLGILLLALAAAGCSSLTSPTSASFASVVIKNHPTEEIAAATAGVFTANGYRGGASGPDQMVFEKEASRGTTMAREGLVATHEGARTIIRVRVEIVTLSETSHRLQCQAFVVTGSGDSFFGEEVRLSNARGGPYRSLLKKAKEDLM